MSDFVVTPEFRVSYPNVFKARLNDLTKKDEFSLVALFPKGADLSKLEKAVDAAVEEEFGDKLGKYPKVFRRPFRDQGDRMRDDGTMPEGYEKGAIFLNLKSINRPAIVGPDAKTPIFEPQEFYAGCYAKAAIRFFWYDQKGNKGVGVGLECLQKTRDGDPLTGRVTPEQAFESVVPVGGNTDEDPFA